MSIHYRFSFLGRRKGGGKNEPSNHRTVRSSVVPVKDFRFSFLPTEFASFVGHHPRPTPRPCSEHSSSCHWCRSSEESIFHSLTYHPPALSCRQLSCDPRASFLLFYGGPGVLHRIPNTRGTKDTRGNVKVREASGGKATSSNSFILCRACTRKVANVRVRSEM